MRVVQVYRVSQGISWGALNQMSHMTRPEVLAGEAAKMEIYGAECV